MKSIMPLVALVAANVYAQQPSQSFSVIPSAQAAELSVTDMLAVKAKIQEADNYTAANSPGLAFLKLLEAKQLAQGGFTSELDSRIQTAVETSNAWLDTYIINVGVLDRTNSGRAEYIQADLLSKQYTPGIQMRQTGGIYTLTLEINTVEMEEPLRTVMRKIIKVPTGTVKTMSGEYQALKQRVDVECANYMARENAATGSTIQAIGGAAQLFNAVDSGSLIGGIMGFAKIVDAGQRQGKSEVADSDCENAMARLENTSMFTQDVVTTPTPYDEITTTKTAIAGIKIYFSEQQNTLYTSPPLDVSFYKRDFSCPDFPEMGIHGDPEEMISDREVRMGLFSAVGNQVYIQFNQGQGLWDVIAWQEAQRKTGSAALEAHVQLFFDGHSKDIKQQAAEYITQHSTITLDQLAQYQ